MNRYDKAKQEHYDIYAKQSKSIHSWKIAFFISMAFCICTLGITGYLTTRSTLIPYVIEVDETGNAKGINPALQKKYIPQEQEKEYFLREFIKRSRNLSSDIGIVNSNFSINKYFLTTKASNKYLRMIEREKIKELVNDEYTRNIQIQTITKMAGTQNSYQARWKEFLFNKQGEEVQSRNYTGIFTLEIMIPNNLLELEVNPLGIKISDFSLSIEK